MPLFVFTIKDPFDCSDMCELAWLIRDNRHLLLPMMAYAKNNSQTNPPTCSNGTSFIYLDPKGIQNCPKCDEI